MTAIGIDLGTTNSVAAVAREGQEPRVLLASDGNGFTPSTVSFDQGTFLVGRKAVDHAIRAPGDTVFSVKRLMGHGRDDDEVVKANEKYPYTITGAVDVEDQGVRVLINGIRYCPEDISAMILRQVVEAAGEDLGEKVTQAVITVPAYFSEPQRLATREAGERAGLIVKKIIDEPTAAALAFGVSRRSEEAHQLLVFDMGGGTLDISIGYMADGEFVGEAIQGDRWLGGDDLDYEIVMMIREWIEQSYGITDLADDSRFQMMARRKAEEAKRVLSDKEEVDLVLPAIVPLPHGEVASVSMRISRAEFEDRIKGHVERGIGEVKEALKRQGLAPEDVSKVLLVGGSTRVPAVRRALIDLFGEEKVRYEVDPMQAVALGAAILAQHLEGVECPKCKKVNPDDARECECGESLSAARAATGKLGLHEVTERDLGICAYDKEKDDPDVFVSLIKKGTPYPLPEPVGKPFRIGGRKITIPTYVGDKEKASANEYLGVVELELPPDVPAQSSVIVKFNYDRNRILTVGVEFPGRSELDFEAAPRRHGLSHPGLGDGKWRIALENTMSYVDRVTEDYGEFLDKERKVTVAEEMERARQALRDDDAGAGERALNGLSHVAQNLGVAGHLFLSQRLSTQADSRTVEQLAVLEKSLREAYRKEDEHGVQQIMRAMEVNFNHIAATVGGGDLQDPRDLLEIVKKEDGE